MDYCDHCQGQRFDRARVLRALRGLRKGFQETDRRCAEAIDYALRTIRTMDVPHLEVIDEGDDIVH